MATATSAAVADVDVDVDVAEAVEEPITSAFVATDGGPLDATLFYVLCMFRQAFQFFNMDYASALAWVLFLIVLTLTLLIVRSSGRWVYYAGEVR